MAQQELDSLFQFPCAFPIKMMGEKDAAIDPLIKAAFKEENIDISKAEWNERLSSNGKYTSITVIFTAESKDQLNRLYQRLSKIPEIKMIL